MNVGKSTRRPRSTRAHLLCVPGSTASDRGGVVVDGTDDLRFLAAHHVGHARRVARHDARDDRQLAPFGRHPSRGQRADGQRTADVGCLDASPAGCRSCRRRGAARGSSCQGPSSSFSASAKPRRRELLDPERRAARVQHRAVGPHAVRPRGGRTPIDADERAGGHESGRGGIGAPEHARRRESILGAPRKPVKWPDQLPASTPPRRPPPSGPRPRRRWRGRRPSARHRACAPSSRTAPASSGNP